MRAIGNVLSEFTNMAGRRFQLVQLFETGALAVTGDDVDWQPILLTTTSVGEPLRAMSWEEMAWLADAVTDALRSRRSGVRPGDLVMPADWPASLSLRELMKRGKLRVRVTGAKRPPKAGEWYVSGSEPMGYYPIGDLVTPYLIGELVEVRETRRTRIVRVVQDIPVGGR